MLIMRDVINYLREKFKSLSTKRSLGMARSPYPYLKPVYISIHICIVFIYLEYVKFIEVHCVHYIGAKEDG